MNRATEGNHTDPVAPTQLNPILQGLIDQVNERQSNNADALHFQTELKKLQQVMDSWNSMANEKGYLKVVDCLIRAPKKGGPHGL